MYGMSIREVRGRASLMPFIDRVIDGGPDAVTAPDDALSVRDYLDLMLAGSFPEPSLRIPAAARRRWFAGYVEQMITRDVPAVAPRRDPELLRRYLSVLAVNTAGIAAESTLWSAAGINAKTAQAYQVLFQRMFVLDLVPAWFSNRIKRLVKAPKRYLVDPALVTAVLGLGRDAILYGPEMLGRLLDTFVAAQLRAELAASRNDPRLYHLREEQGRREVDLLIETASGQLIGIEVKAAGMCSSPGSPSTLPREMAKTRQAGRRPAGGVPRAAALLVPVRHARSARPGTGACPRRAAQAARVRGRLRDRRCVSDSSPLLDRAGIEEALRRLGDRLASRGVVADRGTGWFLVVLPTAGERFAGHAPPPVRNKWELRSWTTNSISCYGQLLLSYTDICSTSMRRRRAPWP